MGTLYRYASSDWRLSGRGLAYWAGESDGEDERILYVTPGYRLIALDAKTGRPVPEFGEDGIVDPDDACPDEAGEAASDDPQNHGCPAVEPED